jgi:hypothetical protein
MAGLRSTKPGHRAAIVINLDIPAFFTERPRRPVTVITDAEAAGLAEVQFGAKQGHRGIPIFMRVPSFDELTISSVNVPTSVKVISVTVTKEGFGSDVGAVTKTPGTDTAGRAPDLTLPLMRRS